MRVGLADELHVAVFDAVVDHLDEVSGAVGSDVGRAGNAALDGSAGPGALEGLARVGIDLRRDGSPDRGEFLPRRLGAAWHERRAETRPFLAAGHARADEAQSSCRELSLAADRVGPQGVAAIDDDVVLVQQRDEAVDHGVGGPAGLHEDDELARAFDRSNEVLEAQRGVQSARRGGVLLDELLGLRRRAVVDRDAEAVIGDVEREVLTHHREADETDVGSRGVHGRSSHVCACPSPGWRSARTSRVRSPASVAWGHRRCLSPSRPPSSAPSPRTSGRPSSAGWPGP